MSRNSSSEEQVEWRKLVERWENEDLQSQLTAHFPSVFDGDPKKVNPMTRILCNITFNFIAKIYARAYGSPDNTTVKLYEEKAKALSYYNEQMPDLSETIAKIIPQIIRNDDNYSLKGAKRLLDFLEEHLLHPSPESTFLQYFTDSYISEILGSEREIK